MTSNLTPGQDGSVNLSATVVSNRVVTASTVNLGTAFVNTTLTGSSSLSTTGADNERTRVSVATTGGPSGGVSVTGGSGTLFDAATDTGTRSVSGSFATAGNKSGSVTLTTTGEGLTGEAPVNVAVGYTATVLDHSNASFDGAIDDNTLNIDFGTVTVGGTLSESFSIFNLLSTAGFTGALDLDSFSESGDTFGKFSTDLATFAGLAAGSSNTYNIFFDTSTTGVFSASYTINLSDEDIAGANTQQLTINVSGNVIPEPGAAALLAVGLLLIARRDGH